MPSRFVHRPPGPILPGFTGRKPSGIHAATVSRPWLWSVPAFLPGEASVDTSVLRSGAHPRRRPLVSATCEENNWAVGRRRETSELGGERGRPGRPPARGTRALRRASFDVRNRGSLGHHWGRKCVISKDWARTGAVSLARPQEERWRISASRFIECLICMALGTLSFSPQLAEFYCTEMFANVTDKKLSWTSFRVEIYARLANFCFPVECLHLAIWA